jgi:hypothetical protein
MLKCWSVKDLSSFFLSPAELSISGLWQIAVSSVISCTVLYYTKSRLCKINFEKKTSALPKITGLKLYDREYVAKHKPFVMWQLHTMPFGGEQNHSMVIGSKTT